MTKVDFHVLEGVEQLSLRDIYACRLINKAFKAGSEVYVAAASAEHVKALDELLWREPINAFVPHLADPSVHERVNIGYNCEPIKHQDCLINLSDGIPTFSARFTRIFEIVLSAPQAREMSRERHKFYKDRGFPINVNSIPSGTVHG